MKKLVAFLTVLFVSVLCTACINNIAVQELNNKAKEYLEAGDAQSAICRLQSSVDLDGNIFETRYNLAVAYIKNKDFNGAKEQIEVAIKLKPDHADSYYSLGVVNEGLAQETLEPVVEEGKEPPVLDQKELELGILRLKEANQAYEYYLTKSPEAVDKVQVKAQMDVIDSKIKELTKQLETAPEAEGE